jgi:hypothetical protein
MLHEDVLPFVAWLLELHNLIEHTCIILHPLLVQGAILKVPFSRCHFPFLLPLRFDCSIGEIYLGRQSLKC